MQEQPHYIDQLFKKAVERHGEMPSAKVWEGLEKTLQKRNVTSINKKYKKWRWVAAALFIFSAGLAMYTISLTIKYKKAVEKKLSDPAANTSKKHHTNSTIAYNNNNGETIDNIKIGRDSSQKTNGKIATADYLSHPQGAFITNNKSKKNGVVVITAKAQETQEEPLLNKTKVERINEAKATVALQPKIVIKYNNKRRVEGQSNFTAKKSVEQPTVSNSTNSGKKEYYKKGSEAFSAPTKQEESSKVLGYQIITSTIHGGINRSIGLAQVPDNLLKDASSITSLTGNIVGAASQTGKGFKNNKIGTVRVSMNRGKYEASVYYSQHAVYNRLSPNNPDFREDNYVQIKNSEKSAVGNVVGLSIVRNIGKFGIETGLSLQTFMIDIASKPLVARRDNEGKINYRISTSSGYGYYLIKNRPNPSLMDTIHTISSKSTIKYISIPLGMQYNFFVAKRVNFSLSALLSANFMTNAKITTIQSLERTFSSDLEGLKKHYLSGVLRLEAGYNLTRRVGIDLAPSYTIGLSDATETRPVTTRRNALGLSAGLNFKF